jgi:hypothetical protein
LRNHGLANSVFASLADIMDACEMAWNRFATNHGLVRSLCAVAWAPGSSRAVGRARYRIAALDRTTLTSGNFRRSVFIFRDTGIAVQLAIGAVRLLRLGAAAA